MNATVQAARTAYAPSNALRVTAKNSTAVAFVGECKNYAGETRYFAFVFTGRRKKPEQDSGNYRSEEKHNAFVARCFENCAAWEARKAAEKAAAKERRKNHQLKVGSVVVASWGYDQTNVNAYQVVKVSGTMVTVRAIYNRSVKDSGSHERVVPAVDSFKQDEEPLRCRVNSHGNGIKVSQSIRPTLWDGERSYHRTASGWGH